MLRREFEKKLREEQEATAHVFQEFLQSFQATPVPKSKTFVRSGVLHPNSHEEDTEKGQIYNPKPLFKQQKAVAIKDVIECARLVKESKVERARGQEKPKSNLEALKEELKMRHAFNKSKTVMETVSLHSSDPATTNLFVANLNPTVTENDLMLLFGAYGPLASVKIMWPRGDDKTRSTNCGFVAFMSRKDGERALKELQHRDDMRVGWAKWVEIPSHPIYVPPELLKMYLPPLPSGLPFNAQPLNRTFKEPTCEEEMTKLLYNSVVKVAVPLNKVILMTVHRTVEFVAREGPLFEAIIMNREINNPLYQFLFDNKSAIHTYYRWKLYSILQGESPREWSTTKFRMFNGGSIWIPPTVPDYTKGMPDDLILSISKDATTCLSDTQCSRLVHYIQNMNMQRATIAECMRFCLNHQAAAKDITDIITDSFANTKTKPTKKIARLYLINDILCNTVNNRIQKISAHFQNEFKERLVEIFERLTETLKMLQKQTDKDEYKRRVFNVLKAWDVWKIYPKDYLDKLKNVFVPLMTSDDGDSDGDGPLDGESLIKRSLKHKSYSTVSIQHSPCFVPSKWEVVDPEQVEAQAMSTKKLYDMECQRQLQERSSKILSEEERRKLREIEVMVLQFQEELEMGKRMPVKKGYSIENEVKSYREYLMSKIKNSKEDDNRLKKHKKESSSKSKSKRKSRK